MDRETARQQGPRVLVVDDDDDQRGAIEEVLRREGYAVTTARSGADAVEAARASPPEVAVLDVFLGDAGGLGVARALRGELSDVRVLFVTGLSLPSVREALAPAPVLFKPFSRAQLLDGVRRIAGRP